MPTYEYKCGDCNNSFETYQPITDDPLTDCPTCHGDIRRVIGGNIGISFKGSGFYVTDKNKTSSESKNKS